MKKVSILVLESSVMQAIADPQYCFSAANQFLQIAGHTALFDVKLVGLNHETKLHEGRYSVFADRLISEEFESDLVIIPALFGAMSTAIAANTNFIPWILRQKEE